MSCEKFGWGIYGGLERRYCTLVGIDTGCGNDQNACVIPEELGGRAWLTQKQRYRIYTALAKARRDQENRLITPTHLP